MAISNFIPTVWSRQLNLELRRRLVGLGIVNQDYIGEIRNAGDKVKINKPAAITVGTYTTGSDITIQTPTSSQLEFEIDQQKYIAFSVDDVDQVQANIDLVGTYADDGMYRLQKTVDSFILGAYTGAHADNVIAKATLTKSNIFDKIAEAAENLDGKDVPMDGRRFLCLSPAEVKYLRTSAEFTPASELGDEVKRTGMVGEVLGFNIFMTNALTTANDGSDDVRHNLYGHPMAITFGLQFTRTEASRMEKQFGTLVKSLMLYGKKEVKSEALGDLRATV